MVQRLRLVLTLCALVASAGAAPASAAEVDVTATVVSADAQKLTISGTAEGPPGAPAYQYQSILMIVLMPADPERARPAEACPPSSEERQRRLDSHTERGSAGTLLDTEFFGPGPFTVEHPLYTYDAMGGHRLCVYLTHHPPGSQPGQPPIEVRDEVVLESAGKTLGWVISGKPSYIAPLEGDHAVTNTSFRCYVKGSRSPDAACEWSGRYTISTTKAWATKLGLPSTTITTVDVSHKRWLVYPPLSSRVHRKLWRYGRNKIPLIHTFKVTAPMQARVVERGKLGQPKLFPMLRA